MHASACRTTKKVPRSRSSLGRRAPARGTRLRSRSSQRPREACGTVYAGAWPQVHWPRVSRGGRLVTEVRRQGQSSSPQPDESGRAVPVAAVALPSRLRPSLHPAIPTADWLDERPTSNGAVCSRVEPARLGGRWFGADGPPSPPPSPRDLQRCLKVRQVRHRAPPRYTKCACGR